MEGYIWTLNHEEDHCKGDCMAQMNEDEKKILKDFEKTIKEAAHILHEVCAVEVSEKLLYFGGFAIRLCFRLNDNLYDDKVEG
jgi:hypothetical protein